MSDMVDIRQELTAFEQAHPDLELVAYVDLSARMVLRTASRHSQNQEELDALAQRAAQILGALPGLGLDLADPAICYRVDAERVTAYVSCAETPDEALALVIDPAAEPAPIAEDAGRLLRRIIAGAP